MAAAIINAAVAKALYETQIETLASFKTYLMTKDDVDMEFMEELITTFQSSLTVPKLDGGVKKGTKKTVIDGQEKKKRAASAYTLFIKHKMHLLKSDDIKSGKDLMSKAVEAWGELSIEEKTTLKDTLKTNPELCAKELYQMVFASS